MKKFFTIIIASAMLGAVPAFAASAEAEATALPKELSDLGVTSQDLQDVDQQGISEEATPGELQMFRRRSCPRGYRMEAYRVRIGRFVIVRYRCVRHHRRHWDVQQNQSTQSMDPVEIPETVE